MKKFNVDKKSVIGFDMDGVILNNSDSKIKIAKKHGFELQLHHTPSEIIKTILPQFVLEKLQKTLYNNPKVALSTPLMRGVKGLLTELISREIPIFLISRRRMPDIAIKILHKHGLWPKRFNENNSYFVVEPKDKNTQAVRLGITHFIDDELENINALTSVPNKFLFDQFGVFSDAEHYKRVKSWSDFKKQLFYGI